MNIAAVVVWFNPREEFVRNISTYGGHLSSVIIVDNSPSSNAALAQQLPYARYVPNNDNLGLSKAFNRGCEIAREQGAEWVLTMDQDSSFEEADIRRFLARARELCATSPDVAILSPSLESRSDAANVQECDSAITSGSLLRLSALHSVSGYNEQLFIDDVDHDLGYRLRRQGWRILRLGDVCMRHTIGEPLVRRFLWRQIRSTNHNHIRKYYMTRSRLYMRKTYPEFGAPYLKMIFVDFLKVLLVERQKLLKIKFMARGAVDHFKGLTGKQL
jgi:rhamnosyltransferase